VADRKIAHLFTSPEEITARVGQLGEQIMEEGPEDVLLVTMLHGGVPFLADLVRTLSPAVEVDFMRLSPYSESEHPPGAARIVKDLDHPASGRHVVIVEDVVDTGLSLAFLIRNLEAREPSSVRVCTLLDRASKRVVDLPIAFRGFEIGDEFLVGYGLDLAGLYRNLPCLVAIDDLEALREDPNRLLPLLDAWSIW
jgi:hypoxanthine phosphoribosyltransferase